MKKCLFSLWTLLALSAAAQPITTPPSGDNQPASVTQYMGLASVTIRYSSPDVTGPGGEDRRGHIWGELVPWGMQNLGFGTAKLSPWRAGANENTTITFSHDVTVEGQPLKAGTYGLHMIPVQSGPWTIIFSHNSTAWGSYFYDPAEDALRVTVSPVQNTYQEWLTYVFEDRHVDHCTASLQWENLKIPFRIKTDYINQYLANIRRELQLTTGFSWQGWQTAAQFCLQYKVNLAEAETWAQYAVNMPFVGEENFTTLSTLSQVKAALGKTAEAETLMQQAISHPTATVLQVHSYGRQLLAQGRAAEALAAFELNARRYPDQWPVHVGLTRGYAATGDLKKALKHARLALPAAPDDLNRKSIQDMITKLERGENIN
ncbi:MAG: DUF2911 domain-containing protein [Bacteroidia bacterium]|nr:DUF2911 domain-containing protein [Bacteroidia bacterium]